MTAANPRVVGVSIKRKEDFRLLTGRGKYAADVRLPGLLQAAMLRSPHPHARIAAIRAGAARALPGVAAVITADDLGSVGRIPVRLGQRSGAGATACAAPGRRSRLARCCCTSARTTAPESTNTSAEPGACQTSSASSSVNGHRTPSERHAM